MKSMILVSLGLLGACIARADGEAEVRLPEARVGCTATGGEFNWNSAGVLRFDAEGTLTGESEPPMARDSGVSVVLWADGRAPVAAVLRTAWGSQIRSFYLAGTRADDEPVVFPLSASDGSGDLGAGIGGPLNRRDLYQAFGRDGVMELRIVRHSQGVRYLWGRPRGSGAARPWSEGDVNFSLSQVAEVGEGALLPGLVKSLRKRRGLREGTRTLVLLEFSKGVRVLDFLRAVECAEGLNDVVFEPPAGIVRPSLQAVQLPEGSERDVSVLKDSVSGALVVDVVPVSQGSLSGYWVKKRKLTAEEIPASASVPTLLRIDQSAEWSQAQCAIDSIRGKGSEVWFGIGRVSPGYRHHRKFHVPNISTDNVVTLSLAEAEVLDLTLDGRSVKLVVQGASAAGKVVQVTLGLLSRGASGVAFEATE